MLSASGEFPPRLVLLKDGSRAVLRRVTLDDAPHVLEAERAVVAAGLGVVRDLDDLPPDADAMRKLLRPWVEGVRSGVEACMLVAAAGEGNADARPDGLLILGIGHLRRLRPALVRHVAQTSLEVHPAAQRLGVGRALMGGLLDWAPSVGVNRVQLNVVADNHRAIALYESLGFERCGVRRRMLRRPDGTELDDLEMGLLLDEPRTP